MTLTLEHLRGGTYYFSLKYTNAGIYMYKKQCVLIDTGATEEEGKAIVEYMKSKGLTLDCIMITHAHADNLAGAHYIKNKTKARLYASKDEALVIENPKKSTYASIISELKEVDIPEQALNRDGKIDEKIIHFIPTKKKIMQHIVLKHEKCLVDDYLVPDKPFMMPSTKHKLEIVNLSGHSTGQVGIVTPDKVFFIGDSLYSAEELAENPIPYSADLTKTKKTLDYLLKSKYTLFVPTHGKPLEFTITAEVYNNQRQIKMLEETIIMHLSMPKTTDELVALVLASFEIEENIPNFYMISSTISAYLEDLKKAKKLKAIHEKGKTRWFADF
jgi:glyoxylase-like metal-dependent hydrolase (beta-lactamase superfamily II)